MDNLELSVYLESLPLLWQGVKQTLLVAVYSLLVSSLGGLLFGILRTFTFRWLRTITRGYIEIFRAIPVLVFMFFFYFGLPIFWGVEVSSILAAVLALSLWGIAEVGEIVRGAIQSLPKGQSEAGNSIGLSSYQLYRFILIPQALRRMVPPVMNIFTRIIKTTSLSVLIGVIEMIKVGQQIIERTGQSVLMYTTLFILYFFICYPLSLWSKKLERKWRYA